MVRVKLGDTETLTFGDGSRSPRETLSFPATGADNWFAFGLRAFASRVANRGLRSVARRESRDASSRLPRRGPSR